MRFLLAIINGLAAFVQRNPLTVLIVLILALAAPAVLKGIAMFILYFILGVIALAVVAMLIFRWKIYQVQQQMQDQFRNAQGGFYRQPGQTEPSAEQGDVKVYTTSEAPEKRVSKNVGDYVDFEETKE